MLITEGVLDMSRSLLDITTFYGTHEHKFRVGLSLQRVVDYFVDHAKYSDFGFIRLIYAHATERMGAYDASAAAVIKVLVKARGEPADDFKFVFNQVAGTMSRLIRVVSTGNVDGTPWAITLGLFVGNKGKQWALDRGLRLMQSVVEAIHENGNIDDLSKALLWLTDYQCPFPLFNQFRVGVAQMLLNFGADPNFVLLAPNDTEGVAEKVVNDENAAENFRCDIQPVPEQPFNTLSQSAFNTRAQSADLSRGDSAHSMDISASPAAAPDETEIHTNSVFRAIAVADPLMLKTLLDSDRVKLEFQLEGLLQHHSSSAEDENLHVVGQRPRPTRSPFRTYPVLAAGNQPPTKTALDYACALVPPSPTKGSFSKTALDYARALVPPSPTKGLFSNKSPFSTPGPEVIVRAKRKQCVRLLEAAQLVNGAQSRSRRVYARPVPFST